MNEIDNSEDELGLPSWYSLTIRKQFAPLILNILLELLQCWLTAANGENASPLALGVL